MTHRLATKCAKNYCNRTPILKVIVENVVTCFLGGHSVVKLIKFLCMYLIWQMRFGVLQNSEMEKQVKYMQNELANLR